MLLILSSGNLVVETLEDEREFPAEKIEREITNIHSKQENP